MCDWYRVVSLVWILCILVCSVWIWVSGISMRLFGCVSGMDTVMYYMFSLGMGLWYETGLVP